MGCVHSHQIHLIYSACVFLSKIKKNVDSYLYQTQTKSAVFSMILSDPKRTKKYTFECSDVDLTSIAYTTCSPIDCNVNNNLFK